MASPAFEKIPPLDHVMNHYYRVDDSMNLQKVKRLQGQAKLSQFYACYFLLIYFLNLLILGFGN